MAFALEICLLRVLRRCGTSLELSEVRTRVRRPANERMKFNHLNFKAMKKMGINTVVLIRAGLGKWIASPFQCLLGKEDVYYPVSYTHLTLPTILRV